jgi:hypothetical protein
MEKTACHGLDRTGVENRTHRNVDTCSYDQQEALVYEGNKAMDMVGARMQGGDSAVYITMAVKVLD